MLDRIHYFNYSLFLTHPVYDVYELQTTRLLLNYVYPYRIRLFCIVINAIRFYSDFIL